MGAVIAGVIGYIVTSVDLIYHKFHSTDQSVLSSNTGEGE